MSFSDGLSISPLKAVSPTIAVSSPRGQESACPRSTIQARMKGADAAPKSSQRRIGKLSKPLQLLFPTPQTQSLGSSRATFSVSNENHSRKRLPTRTRAATIPRISERLSFSVPMAATLSLSLVQRAGYVGSRDRATLGTDAAASRDLARRERRAREGCRSRWLHRPLVR